MDYMGGARDEEGKGGGVGGGGGGRGGCRRHTWLYGVALFVMFHVPRRVSRMYVLYIRTYVDSDGAGSTVPQLLYSIQIQCAGIPRQ